MTINEAVKGFIVTEILADQGPGVLTDTAPLIDSGIIDSLGIMALLDFLEGQYSIQIDGDDLLPENFESVMTISLLVAQKTGNTIEA